MKRNLQVAAYFNLALAALVFISGAGSWSTFAFIQIGFYAGTGAYYLHLASAKFEKLVEQKGMLLTTAIIGLFFNLIAAIIIFDLRDKIKKQEGLEGAMPNAPNPKKGKPKEVISPEMKRLDAILKLGVFMVVVAGIIFATTSWETFPNIFRFIFLVLLGLVFVVLSKFSEIKLKIRTTTVSYWVISEVFFALAIISLGYFNILGDWFSLSGAGLHLFHTVLALEIATFMYITYKRFSSKFALYTAYLSVTCVISSLLLHFTVTPLLILTILTVGCLLIEAFVKEDLVELKCLKSYTAVVSYLFAFLAMFTFIAEEANKIIVVITAVITMFNLLYLALKTKENAKGTASSIFMPFVIALAITKLATSGYAVINDTASLMLIMLVGALLYIFLTMSGLSSLNEKFHKNFQISMNALFCIVCLNAFNIDSTLPMLIAIILMLTNLLPLLFLENNTLYIEKNTQPFKILLAIHLLSAWLNFMEVAISDALVWSVSGMLLLIIFIFQKVEKMKKLYYFVLLGTVAVVTIGTEGLKPNVYESILLIALASAPFVIGELFPVFKKYNIATFSLMLLNIYFIMIDVNALGLSEHLCALIVLIIYLPFVYFYKSEKTIGNIALLAVVLPALELIGSLPYEYLELSNILENLLLFYLLFIVCFKIIKTPKNKNIIAAIFSSIILLNIMFSSGLLVGLYTSIAALAVMSVGYKFDNYKSLFPVGIIFSVANIIYQGRDLLTKLPFWLYLLVAGLSLIGFVTYKELSKVKEKEAEITGKR